MRFTVYTGIMVVVLLSGCIKQAALVYRDVKPLLVVEGMLLTDTTPCTVTLSYSGLFNSAGAQQQQPIEDAAVFIKDEAGNIIPLQHQRDGMYASAGNLGAAAGRSYTLNITLANGKKYASYPQKIEPVEQELALDSIGQGVPADVPGLYGGVINIRTKDPVNAKNYYRWTSVDYVSRAVITHCGLSPIPCYNYCYQRYNDPNVYILSDLVVNGSEIRYQPVLTTPYYFYGDHYVEIKQLSITRQVYEFWRLYQEQTSRTGGILDPLPAPIQGNIYSLDDSTELALGYFEASDVASLKLVLAPIFINTYFTFMHSNDYMSNAAVCEEAYANSIRNPPQGWENATKYIYNVY